MNKFQRAQQLYREALDAFKRAGQVIEDAGDDADLEALATALDEAEADVERTKKDMDLLERAARARETNVPDADTTDVDEERSTGDGPRVTRSERTYRPDIPGLFRDVVLAKTENDTQARERLVRNNKEVADELAERARSASDYTERAALDKQARAIGQAATAGGEFIPPLWLNDQYAPLLRARRAFADQCHSQPLPDGTNSINFPKISSGHSVAVQTDGGAVSNTDPVTTSVTAQVQTLAGRSIASYQLVDLAQPGIDEVIYQDILAEYWRQLDVALISGNVTNAKGFLNVSGINTVTYTDATPTGPEMYSPVFQAKAQIEKGAFAPVNFSLWHPSTWDWYLSQLDPQSRPLALSMDFAAFNAMARFNSEAEGLAGNFAGIPVVVDANVPVNLGAGTNESRIGLFNRETLYLWEGVPRFKVADQTNIGNLQYQFVLYGYYAVAFGRQPKMISTIGGTGLIVQSGF